MVSSRRGRVFKDGVLKVWIGFAIAVAALGGALACNAILGLGDYTVTDGGAVVGDENPAACNGAIEAGQCYPCTPTTNDQLESACTTSSCVPYDDNANIPNFDASLPFIPIPPDAS